MSRQIKAQDGSCLFPECDSKGNVVEGAYQHPDGEIEYSLSQCPLCEANKTIAELEAENKRLIKLAAYATAKERMATGEYDRSDIEIVAAYQMGGKVVNDESA